MSKRKGKPEVAGYKINFATGVFTMNYKFAAAANNPGSAEYKILRKIRADFPNIQTTVRPGRRITTTRPNKRLTYANMEKHIRVYPNAEELLARFEMVKSLSAPLASPYKYVSDWFRAQFPDYKNVQKLTENGLVVALVDLPRIEEYATKAEKAA